MPRLHTFVRAAFVSSLTVVALGLFATAAGAVEPLASRGGSRIGAMDPVLATTGILVMSVGLGLMGYTRMRQHPALPRDLPPRQLVLQRLAPQVQPPARPPSPGLALIDALAATSEALDELAGSLPRRRRQRIETAAHRVANARELLEAHTRR